MSMSLINSLELETLFHHPEEGSSRMGLYLRNTNASQTTVEIEAGNITNRQYNSFAEDNYQLTKPDVAVGVSSVSRLGKAEVGESAILVPAPVSKLVYNYLTNLHKIPGVVYPTYEQLNIAVSGNTVQYTLQSNPEDFTELPYPLFMQVDTALVEAMRRDADGTAPADKDYPPTQYLQIVTDAEGWVRTTDLIRNDWQQHFYQTPDQQWWFVHVLSPHIDPKTEEIESLSLLFNADGHIRNNPYSATLNTVYITKHPAAFDPCSGASEDLAIMVEADGSIDITIDTVVYKFNSLEDLQVRASTVLPKDVFLEFLSKVQQSGNTYMGLDYITATTGATTLEVSSSYNGETHDVNHEWIIAYVFTLELIRDSFNRTLIAPSPLADEEDDNKLFLMNTGSLPFELAIDHSGTDLGAGDELTNNESYKYIDGIISCTIDPFIPYPDNTPLQSLSTIALPITPVNETDSVYMFRTNVGGDRDIHFISTAANGTYDIPTLGISIQLVHEWGEGNLYITSLLPEPVEVTVMSHNGHIRTDNLSVKIDGANKERISFTLAPLPVTDNLLFVMNTEHFVQRAG